MSGIVKRCDRCKGKRGRMLAPRPKGRWLDARTHRMRNTEQWVKCDICHGDGKLVYPYI